jgi:peptidoglycan/LPS O-acetylase OafA/YrhL
MNDSSTKPGLFKRIFGLSLLADHFPALHGLRFFAIVTVLQFHVTLALRGDKILPDGRFMFNSTNVFFGMDLFFILSGFLIGTILLHSVEGHGLRSVGRFYVRRGFRTFPLYYVVLTLMALFWPMQAARQADLLLEYTYLANYGNALPHTRVMHWAWSLCLEEHFYILVPFFMIALHLLRSHRWRLGVLVLLWFAGLAVRLYTFNNYPEPWTGQKLFQQLYIRTHTRFDILVAGIFLAYVQRYFKPRIEKILANKLGRLSAWLIPLACLVVLTHPKAIFENFFLFKVFAWGTITSIMYVPLILFLINADSWLRRLLSARVFLRLATLGYGIYLVHIPVAAFLMVFIRAFVRRFDLSVVFVWPVFLFLLLFFSGILAYFLHLLIEKPSLYLRDRIAP